MCSGEVHFEPTAQDIRLYNSTGKYKVCEETVRWNIFFICCLILKNMNSSNRSSCCLESNKLTEGCEAAREEGCTEIFGGVQPLQALPGIGSQSIWIPRKCPGCPFFCPRTTPCRVRSRGQRGVRCCKPIGLGRSSVVLGCPFRCFT